jgi:hypothetical protein
MQAGLSALMSDEHRAGIRVRAYSALQLRPTNGRPTGARRTCHTQIPTAHEHVEVYVGGIRGERGRTEQN